MSDQIKSLAQSKWYVYIGLILFAVSTRMLPHPPNMTAVGSVALLGGAFLTRKHWALMVPILAVLFSDIVLNNTIYAEYFTGFTLLTPGIGWILAGFVGMFLVSKLIFSKSKGAIPTLVAVIAGSLIFFLLSNTGTWMTSLMYPKSLSGFIACLVAGIPFLINNLIGNLVYSAALFGAYHWVIKNKPYLVVNFSKS